jgi:ribosomal protection tetracycline resistance protein
MPSQTVNIGILAHVDAGKTSLTERLLYDSGVIDRLGSVDAGTTQTDTGTIERRRGITIRSAVTGFTVGDRRVNLIDTPGHSDFVAEVERALAVLDAAVLVLSAVEGVQPHTRLLMRILRQLRLPALVFVNKIDRVGARAADLVADIAASLTPLVVPLGGVRDIGRHASGSPSTGASRTGRSAGSAGRSARCGWSASRTAPGGRSPPAGSPRCAACRRSASATSSARPTGWTGRPSSPRPRRVGPDQAQLRLTGSEPEDSLSDHANVV